jgi:hypothetical protein
VPRSLSSNLLSLSPIHTLAPSLLFKRPLIRILNDCAWVLTADISDRSRCKVK